MKEGSRVAGWRQRSVAPRDEGRWELCGETAVAGKAPQRRLTVGNSDFRSGSGSGLFRAFFWSFQVQGVFPDL